ncbi:MAG TPA: cation diffusion facilitator family transporter [Steroidobacteraceae bacterium]|jgi:cobalt-zinc-cadmium efflux system protein|nr:cation diffusion facilitator family transporter [Steroidobacteraceae bacterium]
MSLRSTVRPHDHDDDHAHDHGHRHGHGHGHSHGHQAHAGHAHGRGASEKALLWALWITAGFMVAEAIGGWIAGSLALIADAAHMLADAGALAMSYAAVRAARRPATEVMSYGHHRWQVLAAFVNGLALLLLSAWIVFEAAHRLVSPAAIQARTMVAVAGLGVVANVLSYLVLSRGERTLNVRSALLHVAADILGNIGAVLAGLLIWLTHWTPIDPLLSMITAILIVRGGYRITRESAHILLEGTPAAFDAADVERRIKAAVPTVTAVHHVHAWSLSDERPMLTLHVVVREGADHMACLIGVQGALRAELNIVHATVQIETAACGDDCGGPTR